MLDKFGSIDNTLILSKKNLNSVVDRLREIDKTRIQSQYNTIYIQNNTGSDINSMLSVLGVESELIYNPTTNLAAFINYPTFKGIVPNETTHKNRIAILLKSAKKKEIVEARISGVVAARVNILDEDHTFAEISDGTTQYLQSAASGSIQILSRETGTGVRLCLVLLGGIGELTYLYKTTSAESGGYITAKKLNSAGYKVGDDETFVVVPEITE